MRLLSVANRFPFLTSPWGHSVDGRNPTNQLRLVVYLMIYRVSYIPGGARFQPSTVSPYLSLGIKICCSHTISSLLDVINKRLGSWPSIVLTSSVAVR